jgi:methylmalonyl-CoA mutase C-terminal domain/subunit
VIRLLAERNASDIVVFGGGIVPPEDVQALKELGVDEVFTPGTSMQAIVEYVNRRFGAVAASAR